MIKQVCIFSLMLILYSCQNESIIDPNAHYKIVEYKLDQKDTFGSLLLAATLVMTNDTFENVSFKNDTLCLMNYRGPYKIEKNKLYTDSDTIEIFKEKDKLLLASEKDTIVLIKN